MNAKKLWKYFYKKQPFELTTPRNKHFTVEMTNKSMRFPSPTDQPRPISYERFEEWYHLWFVKGYHEKSYFTNKPGSPAAAFGKVKVLFNSLDHENFLEYLAVLKDDSKFISASPNSATPDIIAQEVVRFKRDTKITSELKKLYSCECQLCGFTFSCFSGKNYAEAHHIKPLGGGHNGKDSLENIIIVCPNHHAMLDYGAIQLNITDIKLKFPHKLNDEFIQYHNEKIYTVQNF